jgi:CubicO group peptidase (beta-lactamase class C family)
MSSLTLADFVEATAKELDIPGVAVATWDGDQESFACHGLTSIENPLPVDADTLFVLGSVTKTFTATTVMRLANDGQIDLDEPVRRYLPELVLADELAANKITLMNLLNHTAGLDWGITVDTGEGNDALADYVARLTELKLVAEPGARASYSQAGYNICGRIIEKVSGLTYERAVSTLVLEPLQLSHSFFARDDIMTRRFAVGHNRGDEGGLSVARLWRRWRGENPGGGLASSAADLIRWARFHLGDRGVEGEAVLPAEVVQRMQQPTVQLQGSTLGDAIAISWFVRDIDGVRTIGHAGSANGQFAELLLVPERRFAMVALCNAFPEGPQFNRSVMRWGLEAYLGLSDREAQPLPYDAARANEVVGRYENEVMVFDIVSDGLRLTLEGGMRPEIRAAADKELPPDYPPAGIGLLPGAKDEYVITDGGMQGLRGFFTRDASGAVIGVDLAGRLLRRAPDEST